MARTTEHLSGALFMRSICLACLVGVLSPTVTVAEEERPETPKQFAGLKYRAIGPAAGGRTSHAIGVPGDPLTYYAAAASGGVWKSEDGGLSFKPIFDDQPASSIGSIAVAPSDRNVIYVGSGEANIRGNVAAGNGIYRSVDGGKTWKHVWDEIGQIGQMAVHPKNADIAFAAVLGHAFGPNKERGIYRTTDGGKTWKCVLFKNIDTGASDVVIDPNNPRVVWAGLWQARRKPWEMTSGGPGSGLYVSRDGGDTWDQLGPDSPKNKPALNGLPPGPWGKVGVAVAPSDSKRIYAIIEAEKGGLYRSDDGGEKWDLVSDDPAIRRRPWYFSTLTVHPANPDVVFCPQVVPLKSIDGGKTFRELKGTSHHDHHDLWIDPTNPKRMIDANDGGVEITTDGGKSWNAPLLPLGQFYHVAADNSFPYRVMGSMQDMGTASGPSRSFNPNGIVKEDWHTVGGGEAGFCVPDPSDPNLVYAGEYGGYISRYDHRTRQSRHVGVFPYDPSGIAPGDLKYRFQWTSPILVSKHDPKTLYHAANVLFRSTTGGQTWEKVSGDLTRNDKNKQRWSGGPITGDNTGVEVYGAIFALSESPVNKKVLWSGSDDGMVHLSQDASYTWKNVTPGIDDLPDWGTVSCVEASPHDEATAYVVVDAHRLDDYRPHLWKTTDFGDTWVRITDGLPTDEYLRVVRADPKKKGVLYAGTERSVWFSPDDGKTWNPLKLNMPTVAISDLVVKDDDLVVATQGRSLFILDDLTPIREWTKAIGNKPVHMFPALPAVRWAKQVNVTHHQEKNAGENAPTGAVFTYCLKNAAKKPIVLEVYDEKNKRVALIEGKEKSAKDEETEDEAPRKPKPEIPGEEGINRFVWDLRHDGAKLIPQAVVDAGDPAEGPLVAPGTYLVKILADGRTLGAKVEVRMDPRVTEPRGVSTLKFPPQLIPVPPRTATPEEIARLDKAVWIYRKNSLDVVREEAKDQEQFALQIRDEITKVTGLVEELRQVRRQIGLHQELLGKEPKAKVFLKMERAVELKIDALEGRLHNPKAKVVYDILAQKGGARLYSQLSSLLAFAANGDGPPTQGQRQLAEDLGRELTELEAEWDKVKTDDIAPVNDLAQKQNAPMIWLRPGK
ncbi:WD40/YVTN/BNR-like repeat-containing protein [Zavarzinella formosa]|uniref:WD40/YVTN/BNR-like repeat-containing protein n=1 Tax=Zavarzinella formosa TaxID=360055 RepID=UPI00030C4CEC|nr:sialidase family protein [Zavarzinella formosa]